MKLEGKVAVVTGGTSGIGLAIAKELAANGAKVILAARDEEKGKRVEKEVPESVFIPTDVTQEASIKKLVERTIEVYGVIDIVVNNAGMNVSHIDITDLTEETYNVLMNTDFKSVVFMTKHTIPHLLKTKGNIVNIASQYAFTPDPEVSLYCSAKAGVVMFTKSMAKEYGKHGVRLNAVCPGGVKTPLLKQFFEDDEDLKSWYANPSIVPLKRVGEPEDIAKVVSFLASEDASYVTGAAWLVDGGSSS